MSADNVVILPDEGADLAAGQAEVRALLERRSLSLAADRCGRLLQAHPGDPVAHALMGDIHAARQQWAEAVEWYALAENLGGGPEVARRRGAAQGMLPRATAHPEPAAEPFDFQRQRTRVLAISLAAGAVLVIAVIIALLALSSGSQPASRTPAPSQPTVAGGGARHESAPAKGAPAGGGGLTAESAAPAPGPAAAAPATGAPAPSPAPPPPSHVPVIITRRMEVPATDEDYIIARAVGTLTWPDGTVMADDVAVMADPYQGYCMVSFRIPLDLPGNLLEDSVTLQAYKVINATLDTDAAMSAVTVRALATISTGRRDHTTLEGLRANLSREARDEWRKTIPTPSAQELRDKIFSTTFWWNPSVPKDQLR